MLSLDALLEESLALHGHKCPGQVLGVRMARLGCAMLGIEEPKTNRDLIVYVEIDRCATDAIQAVTGCKLGRRTLKYIDLGKVAATFLDLGTGTAFRVVAKDNSRDVVWRYVDPGTDAKMVQFEGYQVMPDAALFDVIPVRVNISPEDMPGRPIARIKCDLCNEGINDRREVMREGRALCVSCANGAYYVAIDDAG